MILDAFIAVFACIASTAFYSACWLWSFVCRHKWEVYNDGKGGRFKYCSTCGTAIDE